MVRTYILYKIILSTYRFIQIHFKIKSVDQSSEIDRIVSKNFHSEHYYRYKIAETSRFQ